MGKQSTPRVPLQTPMFDSIGNLTRTWVIFFERLGRLTSSEQESLETAAAADRKATFGLVQELEVADRLTLYYIVRRSGKFLNVVAKIADEAPTGSSAILDIQRSVDDGVTWESIFKPSNLLVLPPASTVTVFKDVFSTTVNTVEIGDLLRIGCTQIGSTKPGKGIEVVLQWEEEAAK